MGWKGESRRHSLSRKGIRTNIDKDKRLSVKNYVARGESQLPIHIIEIAKSDLSNSTHWIKDSIKSSATGVIVGFQTDVDRFFEERFQSESQNPDVIYDSFSQTRKALQEEYGNTITLYRFQGNRSNIKNKHTLNWVHSDGMKESFREMFEDYDEERTIIKKEIPIKDIIALNVGSSGRYEEFIVFNHDSEGLVYPSNYLNNNNV